LVSPAHHADAVAGLVGEVAAGSGIGLVEDEGILEAVEIARAAADHGLGDLAGLGGVVVVQADGNLKLEGIGELGPLGHVAVVDDVLLGDHHLGIVLERGDILVELGEEEVEQVRDLVILRGQRAAIDILGEGIEADRQQSGHQQNSDGLFFHMCCFS